MGDVAIRVRGLGKQYRLGGKPRGYATLRDQFRQWFSLRGLMRRARGADALPPFWALKDVSFEVKRGEVVGIIGRNGAGKSTLLKILSRITEPTEGEVDLYGRVGSLLEVGTGFHPELTGRENIFLNGAILGMRRHEILRKFDEIVAFAEVEKFIDTPVKHYSSGMYMRLAFAVAAHLEPEILIVDEVLAVGDAEFQKKCLGKMGDVARSGRTVLFVSHNMAAVQSLCETAIYLLEGKLCGMGATTAIIDQYLAGSADHSLQSRASIKLGADIELLELCLHPRLFASEATAILHLRVRALTAAVIEGLCILIYSKRDFRIAVIDLRVAFGIPRLDQGQELFAEVDAHDINLIEGQYKLGLYLHTNNTQSDFLDLGSFEVTPANSRSGVSPYEAVHRGVVELRLGRPKFTVS